MIKKILKQIVIKTEQITYAALQKTESHHWKNNNSNHRNRESHRKYAQKRISTTESKI